MSRKEMREVHAIVRHLEINDVEYVKALCSEIQNEGARDVIFVQLRMLLQSLSIVKLLFFAALCYCMFEISVSGALTNALIVFVVVEGIKFHLFWRKIRDIFSMEEDLVDPFSYYSHPKRFFLVAVIDGFIAGTVAVMEMDQPDVAKLQRMFVHPNFRRRGIASVLISSCHEECRKLGYRAMSIRTRSTNTNATKCYEKAGYLPADRQIYASIAPYSFDSVHYTRNL